MTEEAVESLVREIGEMSDGIKSSLKKLYEKDNGNKEIIESINTSYLKLIESVSKLKPDFTPIANVISDISKQNASILDILGRAKNTPNVNESIQGLLIANVSKSNELVEKALSQVNYSKELKEIADALNKGNSDKVIEGVVHRDNANFIQRIVLTVKK